MPVIGRDGVQLGRVTGIVGDAERDIFDGIAFRRGLFAPEQLVGLDGIVRITASAVHVGQSAEEAGIVRGPRR